MEANGNNHRRSSEKVLWWIIGLLGTIVLGGLAAYVNDNVQRLGRQRQAIDAVDARVTALEHRVQILEDRLADLRPRTARVETHVFALVRRVWVLEHQLGLPSELPPLQGHEPEPSP